MRAPPPNCRAIPSCATRAHEQGNPSFSIRSAWCTPRPISSPPPRAGIILLLRPCIHFGTPSRPKAIPTKLHKISQIYKKHVPQQVIYNKCNRAMFARAPTARLPPKSAPSFPKSEGCRAGKWAVSHAMRTSKAHTALTAAMKKPHQAAGLERRISTRGGLDKGDSYRGHTEKLKSHPFLCGIAMHPCQCVACSLACSCMDEVAISLSPPLAAWRPVSVSLSCSWSHLPCYAVAG